MSENSQNEYFRDLGYFHYDYNNQFPINPSPEQNSPFKQLHLPLALWDAHHQQAETQKKDVQPTQTHTAALSKERSAANNEVTTPPRIAFEKGVVQRYRTVFRGGKDDTVELNIHFKTILVNFLKELILANELESAQITQFQRFVKRAPSFKSLKELLQFKEGDEGEGRRVNGGNLRRVCVEFAESGEFARRIFLSRCGLDTKLHMIKYVERVGLNMRRKEIVRWKEDSRRPKFQY